VHEFSVEACHGGIELVIVRQQTEGTNQADNNNDGTNGDD
jgi:hypothetical protein